MEGGNNKNDAIQQRITDNLQRLLVEGFLTEEEVFLWTSGAATASEVDAQKLLRDSQSFEKNALYKLSSYFRYQLTNPGFMSNANRKVGPNKVVMLEEKRYSADCMIAMATQQVKYIHDQSACV